MTKLTRFHFRLVADAVLQERKLCQPAMRPTVDAIAKRLAQNLQQTNPEFDTARFLAACGVEESNEA